MPQFTIVALERLIVETTYVVKANTAEEALQACKSGDVEIAQYSVEDEAGEWLQTRSITNPTIEEQFKELQLLVVKKNLLPGDAERMQVLMHCLNESIQHKRCLPEAWQDSVRRTLDAEVA